MDQPKYRIDDCREILRSGGWTCKESVVNAPNCPDYWRIDCASGNKSFAVLAPARGEAWNQAVQEIMRSDEDR